MIPWAHPSPQPKGHLDRFSRFFTDIRRVSLYFKMGRPSPLKIVPSHVDVDPCLIHSSLDPPEFSTQSASRSLQTFLYSSVSSVMLWHAIILSKLPLPMGICTPSISGSLGPHDSASQTASRSVQPFLHGSRQKVLIL